ncbi:MAG: outer membrane lipoprotein-sorting protein [Treponema sp.]|nr:outer membrane lipoprotein-sorting protein [Treponema sp.]
MKRILTAFITLTAALAFGISNAGAEELTGYEIAKRADEVETGETSSYTATMTLVDKKGNKRVREIMMRSKDYGDTTKSVIVFTTPKDVSGVSYLMYEYDDAPDGTSKDSENWLYMPAMKKTRRISGSSKGDDFMGTDFTYEDMGDRGLSKDTFNLLGEENVAGQDCWKVECIAKDTTEKNPRRIIWFRKDNYIMQKAEFYDRQNKLQRVLECSSIKQVSGIWTTGKMYIKNVITKHSTLLEMKNVQYNIPLKDNIFTVAALERGTVR